MVFNHKVGDHLKRLSTLRSCFEIYKECIFQIKLDQNFLEIARVKIENIRK